MGWSATVKAALRLLVADRFVLLLTLVFFRSGMGTTGAGARVVNMGSVIALLFWLLPGVPALQYYGWLPDCTLALVVHRARKRGIPACDSPNYEGCVRMRSCVLTGWSACC